MQKKPLIIFDHVSLSYSGNDPLLLDLNLNFHTHSFYFLTGPSGAGKTSLLKLMYMDVMPTQGQVSVFGHNSANIPQYQIPYIRQKIGMVFQECYMLNHLNLLENVALPLRIRGFNDEDALYNASEMLNWVGLARHVYDYPEALSGGQKQRAAIARAVINRPSLLLVDEPTGNVDKENSMRILHLFEELHKRGTTIIFATHDRSLASAYPYAEILIKDKQIQLSDKQVKRYPTVRTATSLMNNEHQYRNVILSSEGPAS